MAGINAAMTRFVLLRHGQTAWNLQRRNQGKEDIPLDHVGRQQAKQALSSLAEYPFDALWSSPLRRAAETAEIIAASTGLAVRIDHRLVERSYGEWEGRTPEEIGAPYEEYRRDRVLYRPPGGETGIEVFCRCVAFLHEAIAEEPRSNLVVSHGGTIAFLTAALLHGSPSTASALRLANCSLTEVVLLPDGRRVLVRFNDTSHLDPKPIPVVSYELAPLA
ncbi:MAG: histidine phosphatase family protein [Armatimonadota bacterium]